MKENISIIKGMDTLRTIAEERKVSVNVLLKGIAVEIYYRWFANETAIEYVTLNDLISEVIDRSKDKDTIVINDYVCSVMCNNDKAVLCIECEQLECDMIEGLSAFTEEFVLEWADLADNAPIVHQIPRNQMAVRKNRNRTKKTFSDECLHHGFFENAANAPGKAALIYYKNGNKEEISYFCLQDMILKLVLKLSVPAIIGMVVVGLYNFMDGVYVGQMVGDNAMAAISVSYPFTLANSGISTLIGIGSASILSRAIGKRDQSTIDKIMGNLIAMNLIFSLIIMAIGMIFTKQILMLSGASGEILELALRYLRIIFAGSLFVNFAQSSNMIMCGEGLLKQAMLFSAGSAIMNIILDPILFYF